MQATQVRDNIAMEYDLYQQCRVYIPVVPADTMDILSLCYLQCMSGVNEGKC